MSKAILILPEMPENCMVCDLCVKDFETGNYFCSAPEGDWTKDRNKKPEWCLLRHLPEKKMAEWTDDSGVFMLQDYYSLGWNDAIRAIEGSGEDGT